VHINPELVFRRALVLANCREVLSYPIGPIPTAIFHDDGTMRKTCKADLAHLLEQDVLVSSTLPIFDISKTTYIRDGMALLQSVDAKKYRNFGELAMDFVRHQVASFQFSSIDMTYKIQSKVRNENVGPSLSSLQKLFRSSKEESFQIGKNF
jgi:hypothetical protein